MRKLSAFLLGVCATVLFFFCSGFTITTKAESGRYVYIGGMPAGFILNAGGAQVIGISDVTNDQGTSSPARDAGIKSGDLIVNAGGIKVETIQELNEILAKNKENPIELTIKRENTELKLTVQPKFDPTSKKYKIGVLIRDTTTGIGTITYIDANTMKFGSLGHTVGENKPFNPPDGKIYKCNIVRVVKGVKGRAGELHGIFLGDNVIGSAENLSECGIFGKIEDQKNVSQLEKAEADSSFVQPGVAYVYSTIYGQTPKKYSVEIVKVDKNNPENKNYVLKITDKELLEHTGGIVQGMSGSPIIQNNRLVGAITHVFLNDPTRGYGIDIEKMLKN